MLGPLQAPGWVSNSGRTVADIQAWMENVALSIGSGIVPCNDFRLYTVSGKPYADSASSGSSSLYWGPNGRGNIFSQYNATENLFVAGQYAEQNITSLNTWTSGTAYDIYAQLGSSTTSPTFTFTAWSNITTPPTRTMNSGGQLSDSTQAYVYIGSVYYAGAFYDFAGLRGVYNKHNQAIKPLFAADSSGTYSYANVTVRVAHGQSTTSWGVAVVGVMQGENGIVSLTNFQACNVGTTAATFYSCISENTLSNFIAQNGVYMVANGVAAATMGWAGAPLGFNSFLRTEFTVASASVNFDNAPAAGMYGTTVC